MRPALAVVLTLAGGAAAAEDWPQFLGPNGNGAVEDAALDGAVKLKKAWSQPLEGGAAGIVVSGDRLYTLATEGDNDIALALSASDGKQLWRTVLDPSFPAATSGPTSTPALGHGNLYTLTPACKLRAHDPQTGTVRWTVDVKEKFGAQLRLGCHASPLVAGDSLILQAAGRDDHRLVALDPATGAVKWSAKGPRRAISYSTPAVGALGGVRQIVLHHVILPPDPNPDNVAARSGLTAFRLEDGGVLWTVDFEKNVSWETPLLLPGDRVLLLTWNDAQAYKVTRAGDAFRAERAWATEDLISYVSPPVVRDGHVIGFGRDFLTCVNLETGKTVWREKLYPGSVLRAGNRVAVIGANTGMVRVGEADATGWREIAAVQAVNRGASVSTPATLAGGKVFVRAEDELAAVAIER
jgi:outer membrane protein assembly factor BamB